MQEWLISIYASHHYEIYAIIMIVGLFEGPFVSMVCGAILALGFLSFWPVYIALMIGDLVGDVIWYNIGYHFGEKFLARFGKYFSITERHVERVKNVFQVRKYPLLFLSKISNGLGFALAVLFSAGMSRVPFLQFISINALGQLVWSGVLIAIGFFFGDLYLSINNIMGRISLIFLFAVVIFAALRYIKYLQKKID
jgi:membrane protein DedA with SNARE-associated domain